MARIGHRVPSLIARVEALANDALPARRLVGAAVGALAALVPALWMWGYTVDDALIAIRYARHLAMGVGYRFNADGASTDGVTPLAWPFLLASFAKADPLTVLVRAQVLGLVAHVGACAAAGAALARVTSPRWAKAVAACVLLLCVPVAANAVSGMETALALALATLASIAWKRPMHAALLAGAAASLRPEMAPWAIVLSTGFELASARERRSARRLAGVALLAFAPFALCVLVRVVAFGKPAPLALMAKPSDLEHGLAYVGAGFVVTLAPLVACAPLALWRGPRAAFVIVMAAVAHFGAIVLVGGDWMPYARLLVPVVPSLLVAFVVSAPHARGLASLARGVAALAVGGYLIAAGGTSGRDVGADRKRLVADARPYLASAHRVASLDIGWPTAASEASIVDLAGLTDPVIAALPGGHTSKRIDAALLLERDPDVLLVYVVNDTRTPARVVEARLLRSELIDARFERRAFLPLGSRGAGYVVFQRRAAPPSP